MNENHNVASEPAAEEKAGTGPNLVQQYNDLVKEAVALGLSGHRPVNRFSDSKIGARRVEQIKSAIKAYREGIRKSPGEAEKETDMKTNTKKTPAKTSTRSKSSAKAHPKAAQTSARTPVGKERFHYSGGTLKPENIVEATLGARSEGTNKAKLLSYLVKHIKEKVTLNKCISHLYGDSDDARSAFGMVLRGINEHLKAKKIPYTIEKETDEKNVATLSLQPKR